MNNLPSVAFPDGEWGGFVELLPGFVEFLPGVSDIIQPIEPGLTGGRASNQIEPFHDDFIFALLSEGSNRYGTPPGGLEFDIVMRRLPS